MSYAYRDQLIFALRNGYSYIETEHECDEDCDEDCEDSGELPLAEAIAEYNANEPRLLTLAICNRLALRNRGPNAYLKCARCNNIGAADRAETIDEKKYCFSCYREFYVVCCFCTKRCEKIHSTVFNSTRTCCLPCAMSKLTACVTCHGLWVRDDYIDADGRCANCIRIERQHYTLRPSNTDVRETCKSFQAMSYEKPTKLFFGIELEAVALTGNALPVLIDASKDWAIYKQDGSLPENGLEIVSIPASLAWHQNTWPQFLRLAQQHIAAWKHKECGMHVHMTKAALTPLTQGRMLYFMHEPMNGGFINGLAGRNYNRFCVRGPRKSIAGASAEELMGRYQALNFATHHGGVTIECRIFQANIAVEGFLKNIEFCAALCAWSAEASNANLSWQAFVKWSYQRRGVYPSLAKWYERQNIIKPVHQYAEAIQLTA